MRLISADSIMRKMVNMLIESGNLYLAGKAAALIDCEPTVREKLTPMEVREQATSILMRIAPIEAPELLEKYFGIEKKEDLINRLAEYENTGLAPKEILLLRGLNWISCRERLPEDENIVLVTTVTKKGLRNVNRAYCIDGCWHGSGSMAAVIAWRPLPEPYRGKA